MRYVVSDEFVQINEPSGTIQNTSKINVVEISNSAEENSGIMLYPMDRYLFDTPIYARCVEGGGAEVRVVPFELGEKGGGKFDFSLDQLGTTFINNFAFSGLAYPNTADPHLDGKPVLVMAVKDNNDKSQDVKYVFVDFQNLIVHYDDFAGAGVSAAGVSGMVPAPQVGDQNKFLCGNGTWETVSTSLGGISLTLGNVPTFKIRSDNGVEFAADLYPTVADTLIGDTLYFDKHIFQFTGLSSGLTLHESGFYAASDSAYDNSFGSIVAAPNDYSFWFGSESAFDVDDGDVISVTQLDSNPVNLSLNLNLEKLNTGAVTAEAWWNIEGNDKFERDEKQTAGQYVYIPSQRTVNYIKSDSTSYTYSESGVTSNTQPTLNFDIAKCTNIVLVILDRPDTTMKSALSKQLPRYVTVDEIRDSAGNISKFIITLIGDAALQEDGIVGGVEGKVWIDYATATCSDSSIKTEIRLGSDVTAVYRDTEAELHTNGTLVEDPNNSGTYTFTTDQFTEGYYPSTSGNNTNLTLVKVPDGGANGDYCTISGLASGLTIEKVEGTNAYQYNIKKGDEVVGTIDGQTITLTKLAALPSDYANIENFTVKLEDNQVGKHVYILVLSEAEDSEFKTFLDSYGTFEYTAANGNDPAIFTYKSGAIKARFLGIEQNHLLLDGVDTYVNSYVYTTVGVNNLVLTLTGLNEAIPSDLTVYGGWGGTWYNNYKDLLINAVCCFIYYNNIKLCTIDYTNKTVELNARCLPSYDFDANMLYEPDSDVEIVLGGNDDYVFVQGYMLNLYEDFTHYKAYTGSMYDTYDHYNAGTNNSSFWNNNYCISKDGKSIIVVPPSGRGKIKAGRPGGWIVVMNSSGEVFWFPSITQQEYESLTEEEHNAYTKDKDSNSYYNISSISAIKVADFDGETIAINHNVLDNRSLSSPLVLEPKNKGLRGLKLDLATDNETTAISRNFAYETFTAGASAGTYTYAALSSTEGWAVSGDEHQILSVELEGKTFTLNNLRTDLGNLGFDSQGYIHATNGSTIGRMGGTTIKLFDTAVHKLATPTITGTDAADFTLILPT